MSSTSDPGDDELRMRAILRKRGVGPDAELPDVPPGPPPSGFEPERDAEDWWSPKPTEPDDGPSEDDEADPDTGADAERERPAPFAPQPGYWPHPHMPAAITQAPARASAAVSPGTRRLLYNASAAGAGWALGLYRQFAHTLNDCGTNYSISGALILGVGTCLLIAHVWDRRTRHWWPGIAWCARIPLATAILALALWAPASA